MLSTYFVLFFVACFRPISSAGQTYSVTYMNITGDENVTAGFVQMFGYSKLDVRIHVVLRFNQFEKFKMTSQSKRLFYNATEDFSLNQVVISRDVAAVDGIGVGVFSSNLVSIIGVKSDKGSTDAYLSLPVMKASKEFIIALWPNKGVFQGSIQVIGALNGTCVEIYKIFDGNKFVQIGSGSINEFQVYRFFQREKIDKDGNASKELEDLTGYYVNSSRPVQVLVGHECANVPLDVKFCDHMCEQIPPLNQLGKRHVVPPLAGRKLNAGYVIRVVAGSPNSVTIVQVVSYTQKVLKFGEYVEVDVKNNMEPVLVFCDTNCLVMQYNKGFFTISDDDTPTDPFMMLITPSDRFTSDANFATPSYCDEDRQRVNFDNYVTVVTFTANIGDIFYDDLLLTDMIPAASWQTFHEFSIVSFNTLHGFHDLSSLKGSFAAYVYGHSIIYKSASGYGFGANYNITGDSLDQGWKDSEAIVREYTLNSSSPYCDPDSIASGAVISQDKHASFPFLLEAEFQPVELNGNCQLKLKTILEDQLRDLRPKINKWICLHLNCSFVNDFVVAVGNFSTSFVEGSQGMFSGISLYVEMIASYDALADDFAKCRVEIRNYLSYLSNWLPLNQLLAGWSNTDCPSNLTFKNDRFNFSRSTTCKQF